MRFGRLFIAGLLLAAAHAVTMVPLPIYLTAEGASPAMVGAVVGAYAAGQVAFRLLAGWAVDRVPQRPMLLIGGLLVATGLTSIALLPVGWLLVVPRLAHGIGLAAFYTAAYAWISLATDESARGQQIGVFGSATGLALALTPLLGIAVFEERGALFLFFLAAALALSSLLFSVPSISLKQAPAKGAPGSWMPIVVIGLSFLTLGMLEAFLPLIVRERGEESLKAIFLCFGLALALGRLGGGVLSDRFGRGPVAVAGCLVVTSTLVFLGLGRGDLISIALAYGSGMGAATTSVFTQIADEVAPERRGSALALGSLAQDIGLAAGAGLAGLAAERSLASVSWLASACSFLALLLLLSRFRLAVGASPAARDAE